MSGAFPGVVRGRDAADQAPRDGFTAAPGKAPGVGRR
jgi:hypothetical protein